MNTDNIFSIGSEHKVCQDYALSGMVDDNNAYAIVSDGCSASPEVDFGARILAHIAKQKIIFNSNYQVDTDDIGKEIILDAARIFGLLPNLHSQALDATLLIATVKDNMLNAYLYGDGVFVHRSGDEVYSIHINLPCGAPDYLSYHLSGSRMKDYLTLPENTKEVDISDCAYSDIYTPFTPVLIKNRPVKPGDVISVISDGINSFKNSDNSSIQWDTLIDEFTKYKTFEGSFVGRRISAFKRNCLRNNIIHHDDISIASVYI